MSKASSILRHLGDAALLGGLVVAVIGLYHIVIRAGIPYQDPTVEMRLRYAIALGTGRALLGTGLALAAGGGVLRLILKLIPKKKN